MGRRVKINRPSGMKVNIRPPDEVAPPFAEGGIIPPGIPPFAEGGLVPPGNAPLSDLLDLMAERENSTLRMNLFTSASEQVAQDFDTSTAEYLRQVRQRTELETSDEWRRWAETTPFIRFPPEWEVRIVPPYGGAIARFYVRYGDNQCSVYLDCYNRLGYFGAPYWEVYPIDNDTARVPMEDVPGLLELIRQSLEEDHE